MKLRKKEEEMESLPVISCNTFTILTTNCWIIFKFEISILAPDFFIFEKFEK